MLFPYQSGLWGYDDSGDRGMAIPSLATDLWILLGEIRTVDEIATKVNVPNFKKVIPTQRRSLVFLVENAINEVYTPTITKIL